MRLLLDTHIFLWIVSDSRQLKASTRGILLAAEQIFVSAASIWEIAVKSGLGKIEADPGELVSAIEASGFMELPVRAVHAAGIARLPRHHGDPFDRILIAQAIAEPLRLLTADPQLAIYSDVVLTV